MKWVIFGYILTWSWFVYLLWKRDVRISELEAEIDRMREERMLLRFEKKLNKKCNSDKTKTHKRDDVLGEKT